MNDFERRSRIAAEAALRLDNPDITDEEVTATLSRLPRPRILAARVRDRRDPAKRTGSLDVSTSSYPVNAEGLGELRRDFTGGAGGPPSGGAERLYREVVDFVRDYDGEPTQDNVSGDMPGHPSVRTLSRVTRAHGGWRALLRAANRVG